MTLNGSRKQAILVLLLVAIVGTTLAMTLRSTGATGEFGKNGIYFFDPRTGDLFVQPANTLPPVTAPSGEQGAVAYVYSCGSCGSGDRKLVYIETYTDTGRELMAGSAQGAPPNPMLVQKIAANTRVAAAPSPGQAPQWVAGDSAEAAALRQIPQSMCPGTTVQRCNP